MASRSSRCGERSTSRRGIHLTRPHRGDSTHQGKLQRTSMKRIHPTRRSVHTWVGSDMFIDPLLLERILSDMTAASVLQSRAGFLSVGRRRGREARETPTKFEGGVRRTTEPTGVYLRRNTLEWSTKVSVEVLNGRGQQRE